MEIRVNQIDVNLLKEEIELLRKKSISKYSIREIAKNTGFSARNDKFSTKSA